MLVVQCFNKKKETNKLTEQERSAFQPCLSLEVLNIALFGLFIIFLKSLLCNIYFFHYIFLISETITGIQLYVIYTSTRTLFDSLRAQLEMQPCFKACRNESPMHSEKEIYIYIYITIYTCIYIFIYVQWYIYIYIY